MRFPISILLFLLFLDTNSTAQSCNHTITISGNNLHRSVKVNTPTPFNNHLRSYSHFDWGDGTINYLYAPTWGGTAQAGHEYANTGIYNTVFTSFTIDSNANIICTDTIKRTLTVTASACYSKIQYQRNSSNRAEISFQAITPSGSNNKGYLWDFGDGNWSSVPNPIHTYSGTGVYRLYLTTINNPKTCSNTTTHTVAIIDTNDFCSKYKKSIHTYKRKNYVDFSLNLTGTNPHFSSLYHNNGMTVKSHWDFGDGNTFTSTGADLDKNIKTTHKYASTGTYNVSLISEWKTSASSPAFCRDTLYDTIQIAQVYTTKKVIGWIKGDSLT